MDNPTSSSVLINNNTQSPSHYATSTYNEFVYYKQSDSKKGSFLKNLCLFNIMVTCLEWNSIHLDLFTVGCGLYNFNEEAN